MKLSYRNRINAEITAKAWNKPLDKPDWYRMEASDGGAEIIVYDVIGWPFVQAEAFVRDLSALDADHITVRLNSPGGDVFDGVAIYHALRQHKATVTTRIEGMAASIASIIALAGDEVHAYNATRYMIHDPWVFAIGNQYDLRDTADILEKIGADMVDIYASHSKVGKRELKTMMKDEAWLTAKEAHERGFVHKVVDSGQKAQARFDLSVFANVPDDVATDKGGRELNEREIERALRDAGASRSFAKALVSGNYKALRDAEAEAATEELLNKIESLRRK